MLRILPVLVVPLGCELVADIESRTLGETSECKQYCDAMMQTCVGEHQAYASREVCGAVCRHLDKGDVEASGNTLACRSKRVLTISAGEEPTVCEVAGPGSGSPCTTQCQAYCELLVSACPDRVRKLGLSVGECVRQCAALKPSPDFASSEDFTKGDTLGCRLYHLTAATLLPEPHCDHALIIPKVPSEPCLEPAEEAPKCEDYCRILDVACRGDDAVYENVAQCRAACKAFEAAGKLGTNADSNGSTDVVTPDNTIGCRKFHAYSALGDPKLHCHHAAPTADGYCGDEDQAICESYCLLVKRACATDYAAKYASDAECESACRALAGSTEKSAEEEGLEYSIATGERGGATAACVTFHAVRALSDPNECASALGAAPCAN
ncbi:MAG: hypothetical protein ACOY0T_08125 [Myxococcota bacterium]